MPKFKFLRAMLAATFLLAGIVMGIDAATGTATSRQASQSSSLTSSGDITGKVNFRGTAPQLRPILMSKDPVCATEEPGTVLPEDGKVNANSSLPNAFVYISRGSGNLSVAPPATPVTLTQKGCRYEPHVLGIQVGQRLEVVSNDPTTHNIHAMPKMGRDWNVTQQPGSEPVSTKFTHAEIMVPVHCNVHNWMEAFIGVVTNPYYAVTGDTGGFTIKSVPPGDYTLSVWTATFGTQEKQVTVRAGQTATADFTFQAN